MKQFQRWARRLRVNLARSWALTTRTHGQYFITIFVFIGIGIFAALHTMISMMITSIEYKQTGYLDLYLENTNICWRNESLNQGTNDAWNTRLLHLNCNQFQSLHELINHIEKLKNQTLVENPIHREIASKTGEIQSTNFIEESGRAIRKDRRFIFHGNCSHIFEPHSERRKDILSLPIDAASCYAISPSSANKIFSLSSFSSSSHQHYRCLPSFLIIGAMKSGTGELMKWLNLHPFLQVGNGFEYYERRQQLLEPQTYSSSSKNSLLETKNLKEVHYFSKFLSSHRHHNQLHQHPNSSDHRSQPSSASHAHLYEPPSGPHLSSMEKWSMLSEYLNYFPEFTHDEAESIYTFEKSPDYIRNSAILSLISEVLPSIKLILQLRNPAIRALSEFQHHCRKKRFIKLLSDVSVNNRTYFKGNVLKNSFQLKDFHNLDGIEEHFIVPDEVSNHSASFKTSDSYNPHQQHQNHDRFTVNSKDLPINAFISLPYPCSVSDMMTYFTQFDSLYSAKSTLIASSISNNPLKKNDSLVQTEGLKQKNAEDSRHKSNGKKKLEKGGRRLRNQSAIQNAAPEKVEIISNTSQVNSTHPNLPDHLDNRKHENLKNQGPVHLYHASREQGLKPLFIPASQHEKYPKEIFNGLYYNQLHFLFQKFPSDNVLILLQEDMLQNTFRTLRRIESFLSLPCYDYSQVAIVIDADHPPERKPNGVIDKLKRYRRGIRKVFGLDRYYDHHIGGQELFDRSSLPFQNWLNGIYKQNNQQLLKLIDHYYPQSVNVEQSTNSTSPSRGNDGIDLGNESKRQESFSYLNIKEAGWPL